jgi:uncharacterized protein
MKPLIILVLTLLLTTTHAENVAASFHPLDLLGTAQPYDIKTGGPGFNCKAKLNKVEQLICDSWALSYVDRHFGKSYQETLFWAKEQHPLTQQYRQNQRNWLKLRNHCEDESCIGQAYIDKLCYWQSHRLDQSALKVLSTKAQIAHRQQFLQNEQFEQHRVFNTRIRYLCNTLDSRWSAFLPLIQPYQAKKNIKSIKFTVSHLSEKKADRAVCDGFVSLLNRHQDHHSLACRLPNFPLGSDFSLPTTRPITKVEFNRYRKNINTSLIRQYDRLEIGVWPAYYQHGIQPNSIYHKAIVVVKKPQLRTCLWDETGHSGKTYLWSTLTNGFSTSQASQEELTRIGSTNKQYVYQSVAIEEEQVTSFRAASASQLFMYKGETFASHDNRQITRFPPTANRYTLCNINTEINFIKQ